MKDAWFGQFTQFLEVCTSHTSPTSLSWEQMMPQRGNPAAGQWIASS